MKRIIDKNWNLKFINRDKLFLLSSQIISALIGILFGKLIAIYFLPREFGEYNILLATYTFFFSLFISPLLQYLKTITNTKLLKDNFRIYLKLTSLLSLASVCFLTIALWFNDKLNTEIFFLTILVFPANFLYNLLLDYFNVKGDLRQFSKLGMFFNILTLLFLIIAIFFFKIYIDSVILLWFVQILSYIVVVVFFIKKYQIFKLSKSSIAFKVYLKKYLVYSWPLMILAFWNWINSYFDRYLIEYFLSLKEVGLYNANVSLGSKVFLMLNPFFLAILTPIVFNQEATFFEKKQKIKKYAKTYFFIGLILLFSLYLGYDFLGSILLSKNYSEGFHIIFWSALGYFLITFAYLFEVIFYFQKRTKVILMANLVSAIIGVILNIILIPKLGLNGAFFGLVISGVVRLLVIWLNYNKINHIQDISNL